MLNANCGYLGAPNASAFLWHHGPAIKVDLGFDPKYRPTQKASPKSQISGLEALIDTGARESCIDNALAANLALPVIDRRRVSGVNGVLDVDFHVGQIYVPSLRFILSGRFAGVPLAASGFQHQVIVGRSFLSYFKMEYDGPLGDVKVWRDI